MASKNVQISARISNEDAEFLSKLVINGAKTPSDKLRAIITQARKQSIGIQEYTGCYKIIQDMILPINETIRKHELDNDIHSELIIRFFEWFPDLIAYAISSVPDEKTKDITAELEAYENGLADRIFRFFESTMQMGVGGKTSCYDPGIIAERIKPILNLSTIITSLKSKGGQS